MKITAKVLRVFVTDPTSNPDSKFEQSFEVYEFQNGLIMVSSNTTNDWFFASREDIEPCGRANLERIEETQETVTFTREEFLRAIQGSIGEFGKDSVPQKHIEIWKV